MDANNQPTPPATPEPQNSTPPINPPAPPAPPVQDPTIGLYERLLQEQKAEIDNLKARLNSAPPVQTPPSQEFNGDEFFQKPGEVLNRFRQVLMNDVNKTIEPLNQFREQMSRQNAYQVNKGQLEASVPNHLRAYWPAISQRMDMAVSAGYIQDTTINGLIGAFNTILGQIVAQGNTFAPPTPPITPNPPAPNFVPPVIPSSPPPPPTPPNNLRPLTEEEKVVARLNGMDDATYLQHLAGASMIVPVTQRGGK